MKIYTKTGDNGQTSLADGRRVEKTNPRLDAYGTADELNSYVGLLSAKCGDMQEVYLQDLEWIQNKLFNLGASLAAAQGDWIKAEDVTRLENRMDEMQADLPPMRGFILPGGSEKVALAHVCRTITRRLEREMLKISDSEERETSAISPIEAQFVNRLSDFWFVMARKIAQIDKISLFLWKS